MKVTEKIKKEISRIPEGTTFKYQQLKIEPNEYSAAAKAIERLISSHVIKRVSTGVFFKPMKTAFGELKPREEELIKPYLFIKNKRIAYVTGTRLYNQMGLTSQVPKTIKVASKNKRITINNGNLEAKPVKSYVEVTNKNYYLLEVLDALKDFKKIPDLDRKTAIKYLLNRLSELTEKEKGGMIKCALKYPPRTRAFLGALLDKIYNDNVKITLPLKESLNPLTEFDLGITEKLLATTINWNIK